MIHRCIGTCGLREGRRLIDGKYRQGSNPLVACEPAVQCVIFHEFRCGDWAVAGENQYPQHFP